VQPDIRWKQRYANFSVAVRNLEASLRLEEPDIFQRAGMIQFFEMSFELAWKTLKDYLEYQGGQEVKSPRAVIKKAFEIGILQDGETWLRGLEDRNMTAHTYDETSAREVEGLIRERYFPLLESLLGAFKQKLENE